MAEDKRGFLLYCNLLATVRKMPDDKAGVLFKTILRYVNDENPEVDDLIVDLVFEPVKQQLKIDLKKWEAFRQKQSENGAKGGRPKKIDIIVDESQKTQPFFSESQKSLNVNVNDSVNDKVKDNIISKEQGDLILSICDFFEYNKSENHKQQSLIFSFVFSLPHKGKLDFMVKEFKAYSELKKLDGYKHSLANFLGNQSEQFLDGKWDDNWTLKLNDYKAKNGISTVEEKPKISSREKLRLKRAQNG